MTVFYNIRVELDELRDSLIGTIEDSFQEEDKPDRWELGHDAVALFSLSHALMEHQLRELILRNLFSEEYRDSDGVQDWVESQGFYKNMQRAHKVGLISDGLKGKINDVRRTRNRLLHETDERLNIDRWEGQVDKINKAADAPYELLDLLQEDPPAE